jgi:hypothetical protein
MPLFYCVSCNKKKEEKKAKIKRYHLYLDALALMKEHREIPWLQSDPTGIDLIISGVRHQLANLQAKE